MKLLRGKGAVDKGACWMSALNWYVYAGEKGFAWHDHPACVDQVIQRLCIELNDWCEDGVREEMIGPHLFVPVGTVVDWALTERRTYVLVDRAVRVWATDVLDRVGLPEQASQLRALDPIKDIDSVQAAQRAVGPIFELIESSSGHVRPPGSPRLRILYGLESIRDVVMACRDLEINSVTLAAGHASKVLGHGAVQFSSIELRAEQQKILDLILELCAMGRDQAVEPSKSQAQTVCALDGELAWTS